MFNRLKSLLRPPEAKASRTARLIAFESGGRARWTPRDYAALAREGFMQNAIVHRAVKLVAENAASLRVPASTRARPSATAIRCSISSTRPNPRQDGAGVVRGAVRAICCSPATPMSRR